MPLGNHRECGVAIGASEIPIDGLIASPVGEGFQEADYASGSAIGVGFFFFSSRSRHTSFTIDCSSDVCSSDLIDLAN